jgi:hypothetical protein
MTNTDFLNEWDNGILYEKDGRPKWFKFWGEKYADALDIYHIDEDLSQSEKDKLFKDVGIAFINSLFYFLCRANEEERYSRYTPHTRDGRILWNALKRDIDQSYRDYEIAKINGAKGGRPRKETVDDEETP